MISPKGHTTVDGTELVGLYAADGTTNVVDSALEEDFVGIYHPCGGLWVTITNDASLPEVYAPNGSLYVYEPAE